MKLGSSSLLAFVAIWLFSACGEPTTVVHVVPHSYSGPVIIEYGNPNGEEIFFEPGELVTFTIPDDGVLRLNASPPRAGRSVHTFYSMERDGARAKISTDADRTSMQVFAIVNGSTADMGDGESLYWMAYVYGRPADREDWVHQRGQAASRALGVPGLQ